MICIANGGGQDRLHELEVSTEQWEQFEKLTMSGTVSEGGIVHGALWRGVSATTLTMMLPLFPSALRVCHAGRWCGKGPAASSECAHQCTVGYEASGTQSAF